MARNSYTPVNFWLKMPLTELSQWIKTNNQLVQEERANNS